MKPQDLLFFLVLLGLLWFRKPQWLAIAGIVSLILSILLFTFWVFFTAERLTWYAAAFFFCACLVYLVQTRKE